jgi:hypothetical protein
MGRGGRWNKSFGVERVAMFEGPREDSVCV